MRMPRLILEQRPRVTWDVNLLVTILLLLLALALGGLVLRIAGGQPVTLYRNMFLAAFGTKWGLSDTLVKATPLILTTLGVTLAFRMRLWNIGAEGQLYLGALFASGVALHWASPAANPLLTLLLMALVGMLGGMLWGLVVGALKAWFNVNEIITSLMLTYVAYALVNYFVYGPWGERGFGLTPLLPENAWLPRLSDYAATFPWLRGMTLHAGLLIALLTAAGVYVLLRFTKFGFEVTLAGDNPAAARYAGINLSWLTLAVMGLSGGLAGLAGMSEIAGVVHRLQEHISPDYGFTAIIIAWLARLNPVNVLWVSFLFGGLLVGADEIQSAGISTLLQGIVLFVMVSGELLLRYRFRINWPRSSPLESVS